MQKILLVVRFLLLSLFAVALALVFAATLAGFIPQPEYLIDQLSQLRLGYMMALALLSALFIILRSRWFFSFAVLGIALNVFAYPSFFLPAEHAADGTTLKLMSCNIYGQHNYDFAALINLVREQKPDVVCIEESTPQWLKKLTLGLPEYGHVLDEGYLGGCSLLSKLPVQHIETGEIPHIRRFGVRGLINVGGKPVLLIVSHPPAPRDTKRWHIRNREFGRLAKDVAAASTPVIVIGDFNSSAWSSYFQELLSVAGLHNSQSGFGFQPSWSTLMGLPLVPIDQCVYTKDFLTADRQVGPDIHSDHLPLSVGLILKVKSVR